MSEKFRINREEISKLVEQFQDEKSKSKAVKKEYVDKIYRLLGTSVLETAIKKSYLTGFIMNMLNNEEIHHTYTNDEFFEMIEGISNYEIVGDWQKFLTVETGYLFALPKEMQEKFAENFSIGNPDAKECLLSLWDNHIETTGTDVIRPSSPRSTNNITIRCDPNDLKYMTEALRKIFTC